MIFRFLVCFEQCLANCWLIWRSTNGVWCGTFWFCLYGKGLKPCIIIWRCCLKFGSKNFATIPRSIIWSSCNRSPHFLEKTLDNRGLYLWPPAMQLVPHLSNYKSLTVTAPVTKMVGRCISCWGKRPMFRGELLLSHTVGHFWVVDVPIVKDYVIVPAYGYSRNTPSPKTNILIHMLENIGVFKLVQPDLMHQQLEP